MRPAPRGNLAARALHFIQIKIGDQHARLIVIQLADDFAPGADDRGMTPGRASILVHAALRRR